VEELQARWGPFIANAGTYEVSGDTLTTHPVVAKAPELQGKLVGRATIKLEVNNLWVTTVEGARGKAESRIVHVYMRVGDYSLELEGMGLYRQPSLSKISKDLAYAIDKWIKQNRGVLLKRRAGDAALI
jgi:hypothetical protein